MSAGNALFKGMNTTRASSVPPLPSEPDRYFDDVPMMMSRQGTGVPDPSSVKSRKWSQQDQDKYDAQTKKKVMKELISTWQDRLQLISVITTFFAAIESQLLSVVTPDNKRQVSGIGQAATVSLSCSLVVHVFAAILSFIAAFFLVRFRLNEAAREELKVERGGSVKSADYETGPRIISTNPHLEPVGPFRKGHPPTHLLERCHTISMILALVGFILAMIGVMCYVWFSLPTSAGIASSLCVSVCVVASIVAVFSKTVDTMPKNKFVC